VDLLDDQLDAMKAVAAAHTSRSLLEFEKALSVYEKELSEDLIVHSHLSALYDTLLEQNLLRLIEPFSKVVRATRHHGIHPSLH